MANPVLKVKRGFFIAFDEKTGRYIPFFINVRSNDIIWKDTKGFSTTIKNLVDSVEVRERIEPNTTYRFDSGLWKILTLSNNMYQSTLIIPFTNTFFQLKAFNDNGETGENNKNFGTELIAKITFPTAFVSETDFSLQFSLSTSSDVLGRCTISYVPQRNVFNKFDSCIVRIISPTYRFPETFYYEEEYINSKLNIELRGYNTDYVDESGSEEEP